MKTLFTTFMVICAITQFSYAQWTVSGININNTNAGNVGIGTTTPAVKLDVFGKSRVYNQLGTNDYTNVAQHNAQIRIINGLGSFGTRALEIGLLDNGTGIIQANESNVGYNTLALNPVAGNVGIGTISPSYKLDVVGSGRFTTGVFVPDGQAFGVVSIIGAPWANNTLIYKGYSNTYGDYVEMLVPGGSLYSANIRLINNGNVGIGTTTPDQKLTVNGTIHSKEVKVDLNVPAPDYVFEQGYPLAGLNELKAYVNKNHHLPEIPSADVMAKEGINLSEMNMKLLKKVEELTLYLIEKANQVDIQNKQIINQQRQNTIQQQQINEIKQQLKALTKPAIKK